MGFIVGAATDIGTTKSVNQDSMSIRIGQCKEKAIALAILCDGMGGLQKGEIASAMTIQRFIEWSDNRMPDIVCEDNIWELVENDWKTLLEEANEELYKYGQDNHVNLGTTVTGILIVDGEYMVVNVGDSRTYMLNEDIIQITEDQSLMAREVKLGRLTEEQAILDPRRNVLLQCVGATPNIEIEFYIGVVKAGQSFLVCSDGLRHMVSNDELNSLLNPSILKTETDINNALNSVIKLNMDRNETDNITAGYIKVV
ncbi:MAG: protein phosphatase 2C domain-containing protein [Lachnospiraceae bacterium]|nr:protein phosphatase 2C domain-containing protein [Lachnospiraceae bacterium]